MFLRSSVKTALRVTRITIHARKQSSLVDSVLVANRGEIACRVIRSAKRLGIRTVAVYSDADANALHVRLADEAYSIGPAPSQDSYLRMDRVIDVAKKAGVKAIHPGYGFLSENALFADACAAAGIKFIGPPASAIRSMGSKSASKTIMSDANVPIITGYHGEDQSTERLQDEAKKIGYPVLIKAVLGGGGKGMRVVERPEDFTTMLAAARREAMKSFNDDVVLVEKFVVEPRHVEVQVFADGHDNALYFYERDCSVQRRHQKVIEEAPAPGISEATRQSIGEAAVRAARAVGYEGAGTVEFIMDAQEKFFFMEMNTRLQVEHPVTEMITGLDLVELQLRVASGQALPMTQEQVPLKGHSFEARIYAENPARGFLPGSGPLLRLRPPTEVDGEVRVETGVREGDVVSVHYDPMIAKLVVWADTREAALRRLVRCLREYQIAGLATNIPFLTDIATHPAFEAGQVNTAFIETHHDALFAGEAQTSQALSLQSVPSAHLALTAVALVLRDHANLNTHTNSNSTGTVWSKAAGLRLNHTHTVTVPFLPVEESTDESGSSASPSPDVFQVVSSGASPSSFAVSRSSDGSHVSVANARLLNGGESIEAHVDGAFISLDLTQNGGQVTTYNKSFGQGSVKFPTPKWMKEAAGGGDGDSVTAPMTGKIIKINAEAGAEVKKGEPLVVMEAMKMEHVLRAPFSGRISKIMYKEGDQVNERTLLVAFESDEAEEDSK